MINNLEACSTYIFHLDAGLLISFAVSTALGTVKTQTSLIHTFLIFTSHKLTLLKDSMRRVKLFTQYNYAMAVLYPGILLTCEYTYFMDLKCISKILHCYSKHTINLSTHC